MLSRLMMLGVVYISRYHWSESNGIQLKICGSTMFLSVLRRNFLEHQSIFNTKIVTAENQKLRSFLVIFLENSPTRICVRMHIAQSFILTVKHISFI